MLLFIREAIRQESVAAGLFLRLKYLNTGSVSIEGEMLVFLLSKLVGTGHGFYGTQIYDISQYHEQERNFHIGKLHSNQKLSPGKC